MFSANTFCGYGGGSQIPFLPGISKWAGTAVITLAASATGVGVFCPAAPQIYLADPAIGQIGEQSLLPEQLANFQMRGELFRPPLRSKRHLSKQRRYQ